MYKQVAKMKPVARIYEQQLIDEGSLTKEETEAMKVEINERLEQAYNESKQHSFKQEEWNTEQWESIKELDENAAKHSGLPIDHLRETGIKISKLPEHEAFHKNVRKIFEARVKSFETGQNIDWGTAEALACATLIQEGYNVRISGQDVERGTFSHRHAHVFYQDRDGYYNPINAAIVGQDGSKSEGQAGTGRKFIASNSHLSEFAVLGYELGYAQTHPNTLTMWEAQFGDFANGAQVIIDQFICSGESKWNVKNGLVLLLPHGYDGAGPEHSSSRVERYLQLCNQDDTVPEDVATYDNKDMVKRINMRVVMPSNAANYFHLLRTHMRLPFRKPVVVVAPKKLLKFKGAMSDLEDFAGESRWRYLLPDTSKPNPALVKKVIFCSGQVYYDLEAERAKLGRKDVAILRVESLCPFPFKEIIGELKQYSNATDCTWAQEEPKNAGSFYYAQPRMHNILEHMGRSQKTKFRYAGRPIMAASAVGYTKTHNEQLAKLLADAFA